jgi:hypothetical protein
LCVFKVILKVEVNGIADDFESTFFISLPPCLAWEVFLSLQFIFLGQPNTPKNSPLAVWWYGLGRLNTSKPLILVGQSGGFPHLLTRPSCLAAC